MTNPTPNHPSSAGQGATVDHEGLLRGALRDSDSRIPGTPPAPDPADLAPDFPEFEIRGLIGRGGMGAVYEAVQKKLQRTVALKILPKELTASLPKNVAAEFGDRYLREARALASLNHRHILTVHDFGERDGFFWLVTEFVDGVNLRQLMDLGQLSPQEALRITPQICSALEYAHGQGVVHRDIKPENILIDQDGQVRIADFGLAKLLDDPDPVMLTRTTAVFGTPRYMAPEQWRASGTVDHRADIYSLGVVLYEMLTGELPMGHFAPPSKQPGVPPGLDEIVRRTLAQHPENRYQSARDVQSDVERQAASDQGPPSTPSSQSNQGAPGAPERLAKAPLLAVALAVATAAAFFALVFFVERGQRTERHYVAELAHYHEEVESMAEEESWVGPTPTMPRPPSIRAAEFDRFIPSLALTGVAAALLLLLLGFHGIRHIRNSGGRLAGLPLCVFIAWIGPVGAICAAVAAPFSALRRPTDIQTAAIAMTVAAVISGIAGLWFMAREVRRQRGLIAQGVRQTLGGGLLATGYVVVGLLVIGAAAYSGIAPPAAKPIRMARGPILAQDLIGSSKTEIVGLLGAPVSMEAGANTEGWHYSARRADDTTSSLLFDGHAIDCCVVGSNDRRAIVFPNPGTLTTPHLGQPFREAVRSLGSPSSRIGGTMGTTFSWENGLVVHVVGATIVGVEHD